jgi:hypothetical protein
MKSPGTSEGNTPLKWDLFVTPGIPMVSNDLAPGEKRRMWSPISATLIYGQRPRLAVPSAREAWSGTITMTTRL